MKGNNMKTTTAKPTEDKRSEDQARAQLAGIVEMVDALTTASNNDDDAAVETARDAIQNDPLSVEVRTDWHTIGADDTKPTHYRILLCTGGPACQIVGELSIHGEPETAEIQHQDWFTPWVNLYGTSTAEDEALLAYAREFYFGE
jgi:hypothetical protein